MKFFAAIVFVSAVCIPFVNSGGMSYDPSSTLPPSGRSAMSYSVETTSPTKKTFKNAQAPTGKAMTRTETIPTTMKPTTTTQVTTTLEKTTISPEKKQEIVKKFDDIGTYQSGKKRKNYYITKDIMRNWSSANTYCKDRGMNLATFESFEEASYFNSIAGKEVWVGITDAVDEGTFVQVNGTPAPSLPWNTDEPNDYENNEDCVQSGYNGGFNDHDCNLVIRFACEKIEEVDGNDEKHRFV